MHKSSYLFVYGSLLRGFHSEAYQYISQYFEFAGAATVKGLLFDMGDFPAAVETDGDHFVKGELYKLKQDDSYNWAFGQLDDYEGVVVEADEQQLYKRALVKAWCNNTEYISWIYWYNAGVAGKPVIASGDVLEYLKSKKEQQTD
jgi:gamma-glutamylcyclotransferase (GGCT)/AIG2-like uncharacterized protein YtfP